LRTATWQFSQDPNADNHAAAWNFEACDEIASFSEQLKTVVGELFFFVVVVVFR
jgi:hypothetical protein